MAAASIITSVITGGSNSHQTVSEELNATATDFITQGVVGTISSGPPATGGFAVTQDSSPDMGVTVLSGVAYVAGTPSGQDAQVVRARMTSNYTSYGINSNSSGSTKYDWIYLQFSAANANNPDSAADNVVTLYTSRSSSNSSDNGSPPTYGLLIAVVTVANGAVSITNSNIADKRVVCVLASTSTNAVSTGWNTLSYALTYGANNGNKEFTVTTPYDLTGILSPGMKLKVSRSVTPPTQCMAFVAASSQYATKASPTGITFTSAFTCEAWVYLNSYTGNNQIVINRRDAGGTGGGWAFLVNSSGQVWIDYGTGSSFTNFLSYQSIPLKQWVHIAGVVTSVSSKTGQIYINGVAVPTQSSLTATTTLTQASVDLRIGTWASTPANGYFDGYISEARVWSAAQSQASIQANMAISLTGSESNLVSLFQGNGNFNDATSNANNLTANGGAVATQASNPYNATEYVVITKASYSNPTTTLTLFAGNSNTIPNQTLNTPFYSTAREPYGFPSASTNWAVRFLCMVNATGSVTSSTFVNFNNAQLSVPTGIWKLSYLGNLVTGTTNTVAYAILSPSSASSTLIDPASFSELYSVAGSAYGKVSASCSYSPTSQTVVYVNVGGNASMNAGWDANYNSTYTGTPIAASLVITAESAYV